ncbi:His Kinase A (phospho-acceptor) domain-containing protein [Cyclobacterium lianum]|uniref:histidine kinase n=1 Tax=Cyclobacterium lianum TaxID=388280 RepID=A0A1M7JYN0_9BACT|nr:ATP-binding protein [Cyclobacterium lianum]SHM57637.1 His Kinase A (phospho-acceptor) domain-containing protein [Cyclobacterium lianum]
MISIFLLGLVLSLNFFLDSGDAYEPEVHLSNLEERLTEVIKGFDADYIRIVMQSGSNSEVAFSDLNVSHQFPFFLYSEEGDLVYWSDIEMVPEFESFSVSKKYQLVENSRGVYFAKLKKITRNSGHFWLFQVHPFISKLDIENEYLINGINKDTFGNDRFVLSAEKKEGYRDVYFEQEYLFSILFRVGYSSPGYSINSTVLVFFFSLLGLALIIGSDFVFTLWTRGKKTLATFYTFLILGCIRSLMLAFNFPNDFFKAGIFDPALYASSRINPSLGDLLLNVICYLIVLSMVIAILGQKRLLFSFIQFRKKYAEWVHLTAAFLISTLLMFLFFFLYMNIVENAQWNLNIESIPGFNYLRAISLFVVFLGGAGYLLFTIITLNMVLYKKEEDILYPLKVLLLFSLPIIAILVFWNLILLISFIAHLILLVAIISFRLYDNLFKLEFNTFLTFFFACLVGAVITGAASFHHQRNEVVRSKLKFANNIMLDRDVMGEFLLEEIMDRIASDLFIKNRISDPLLSKGPIERKIKKIYLSGYFDQYSQEIVLYNASGQNISNKGEEPDLEEYKITYMNSDYATQVHNLYYVRSTETNMGNRFVAFIKLQRGDAFLGTIVIELNQQQMESGKAFPKLLMDNKYASNYIENDFDFAIFDEGILEYSAGIYSYRGEYMAETLDDQALYKYGLHDEGYHHFGVRFNDKVVVITSSQYPNNYILADIAFFFVCYLIFTLLSISIFLLLSGINQLRYNYATKLQLYLNFAFFFPMLIISVISVGFLSHSYTEDLNRQYFQKAGIIRDNLGRTVAGNQFNRLNREELNDELYALASATDTDINLYLPEGRLLATNQPAIFDKNILSQFLHPSAYAAIIESRENRLLQTEQVGSMLFKTVYLALKHAESQNLQAIIAIPFFEAEEELNLMITEVFSNILIIFVVMFLIFLVISYFVSKHLTQPFRLLTQKLKETNLENNEYMVWPSKDEIGLLVNEYNNMLFKLENSKKVLASNEKESAWREMAKQVAHEIKNPLTPMKLTLQHLLRLQGENKLNDAEALQKPIMSIIHQVDTLSDIASSFSTFAKMPLPQNKELDFREVVVETVSLYCNREDTTIDFDDLVSHEQAIIIMGDRKLYGRVISNLIINGIQAVPEERKPHIQIQLAIENETHVKLAIRDNGKGIDDKLKDKVFLPNFSTKSDGSGLGLAIAKRGVETAGGKIWFHTSADTGTVFYLLFPLVG